MSQQDLNLVIIVIVVIGSLFTGFFALLCKHTPTSIDMPHLSRSSPANRSGGRLPLLCGLRIDWIHKMRPRRRQDEEEAVVHPPVFCIEDLEVPPPIYQRHRQAPPSEEELASLRAQLDSLREMTDSGFAPYEKTIHKADITNLRLWIKHLERLVEKRAAQAAQAQKAAERAAEREAGASSTVGSALRRARARVG